MQLKWIERLFSRLLAIYGDRFSTMWAHTNKDEMKQVWAEALGGFNAEQIAKGLEKCLSEPHSPNLPTFISYCRNYAVLQTRPQIGVMPFSKERAREALKEIKNRYAFGKGKAAAANDLDDF